MKRFIERLLVYVYWPWGKSSLPKPRVKKCDKKEVIMTASGLPGCARALAAAQSDGHDEEPPPGCSGPRSCEALFRHGLRRREAAAHTFPGQEGPGRRTVACSHRPTPLATWACPRRKIPPACTRRIVRYIVRRLARRIVRFPTTSAAIADPKSRRLAADRSTTAGLPGGSFGFRLPRGWPTQNPAGLPGGSFGFQLPQRQAADPKSRRLARRIVRFPTTSAAAPTKIPPACPADRSVSDYLSG